MLGPVADDILKRNRIFGNGPLPNVQCQQLYGLYGCYIGEIWQDKEPEEVTDSALVI